MGVSLEAGTTFSPRGGGGDAVLGDAGETSNGGRQKNSAPEKVQNVAFVNLSDSALLLLLG